MSPDAFAFSRAVTTSKLSSSSSLSDERSTCGHPFVLLAAFVILPLSGYREMRTKDWIHQGNRSKAEARRNITTATNIVNAVQRELKSAEIMKKKRNDGGRVGIE